MLDAAAPLTAAGPQPVASSAPAGHNMSFRQVLSELNPLQYLPVIGTIYRAVTGDQIPEAVRRIGSLVVSGLLGGPIGIVINAGVMVAEKITGIDLDHTGQVLLAGNRSSSHPASGSTRKPAPPQAPIPQVGAGNPPVAPKGNPLGAPPVAPPAQAWSPAQLAAYGVTTSGDGMLIRGDSSGADVLNTLELLRIPLAQAAYGRAVNLAA
jgi:hypothetical protein